MDTDQYYLAEAQRPSRYLGQLSAEFQAALARHYAGTKETDCSFTHSLLLPDGNTLVGDADQRGSEDSYLAGTKVWGKRVLEVLPGSGWLSSFIATRADELVVLDEPPAAESSPSERVRRGWWFARQSLGFEAQVVYADLCALPSDLGRFDIAVLNYALARLHHPFHVIEQIASITNDTIVITQPVRSEDATQGDDPPPLVHFFGGVEGPNYWHHSPSALIRMLVACGFGGISVGMATPGADGLPVIAITGRRTHATSASPSAPIPASVQVSSAPRQPLPSATRPAPPSSGAIPLPGDELPLPTAKGRFSVAGTEDVEAFVILGRAGYRALVSSLERAQVSPDSLGRVLDFGCGVGRVLRYWYAHPSLEVHGTDLNQESIAWCRDNLTFAKFGTNTIEPTLPYPDNHFGFVYALSVFTHLPTQLQQPWRRELLRIIRPGGHLYFTTHGQSYRGALPPALQGQYDRGELVVTGTEQPGSNFCGAFHPPVLVKSIIQQDASLSLIEFKPEGAEGNPTQDSWLVRKLT